MLSTSAKPVAWHVQRRLSSPVAYCVHARSGGNEFIALVAAYYEAVQDGVSEQL